ncbi:MAG: hypothetical protein CXZ00_04410 [Acidobacteria bacterium]|nr:MAG: hypothetical protein CXZ00_04410 [Acidobacteriota bacterium]
MPQLWLFRFVFVLQFFFLFVLKNIVKGLVIAELVVISAATVKNLVKRHVSSWCLIPLLPLRASGLLSRGATRLPRFSGEPFAMRTHHERPTPEHNNSAFFAMQWNEAIRA